MAKTSSNNGDAPSIEDHLALQTQVDELKAALNKLKAAPPAPVASTEPNGEHDLDTYDKGEFKQKGTNEPYKLKLVPGDEHGRKFHLKSKKGFFHAATVEEMSQHFNGDFSEFEPKKPDAAAK